MKKILIALLVTSLAITHCLGQQTSETWKKFTEPFADFELPTKNLINTGSEENINSDDSLTYAKFFNRMKIEKKLRYEASGEKIRCNILIYSGQTDEDNLNSNATSLMKTFKEQFELDIFQIKRETIEKTGQNVRLNLSIASESQKGIIDIMTWIGEKCIVVIASEGAESEIEHLRKNFKFKNY